MSFVDRVALVACLIALTSCAEPKYDSEGYPLYGRGADIADEAMERGESIDICYKYSGRVKKGCVDTFEIYGDK